MKHRFKRFLKCMAKFQFFNVGLIKPPNCNKHQITTNIKYQENNYARENYNQHKQHFKIVTMKRCN